MEQAITLQGFLAFLTYFGVGLGVLFAAVAIVLLTLLVVPIVLLQRHRREEVEGAG